MIKSQGAVSNVNFRAFETAPYYFFDSIINKLFVIAEVEKIV